MARIASKLALLKSAYPHVTTGGYLYANPQDLTRRFRRAALWLLITDGRRWGLRSLDFRRRSAANYERWSEEFPSRYETACSNLIAAMNRRHGGVWYVRRIIGWSGGTDAIRNADRTRPRGAGHRA